MIEVQFLTLGAQLIVAVKHQNVLDNQAVGQPVILIIADLVRPGGCPVDQFQVLVGAAHHLAPAGLIEAEEDVAVLLFIGGLNGSRIAGDNGVIVH